jgi:hypothetical protein
VHAPDAEHPSPVVPQPVQLSPAVPQAAPVAGSVQTLPVQHPVAHEVGVHWQELPEQTCPATHAAPAPQRHPPDGEQLSARLGSHVVHMLPSVPQLESAGVTQVLPLQHPLGHDAELHTHWPLEHS